MVTDLIFPIVQVTLSPAAIGFSAFLVLITGKSGGLLLVWVLHVFLWGVWTYRQGLLADRPQTAAAAPPPPLQRPIPSIVEVSLSPDDTAWVQRVLRVPRQARTPTAADRDRVTMLVLEMATEAAQSNIPIITCGIAMIENRWWVGWTTLGAEFVIARAGVSRLPPHHAVVQIAPDTTIILIAVLPSPASPNDQETTNLLDSLLGIGTASDTTYPPPPAPDPTNHRKKKPPAVGPTTGDGGDSPPPSPLDSPSAQTESSTPAAPGTDQGHHGLLPDYNPHPPPPNGHADGQRDANLPVASGESVCLPPAPVDPSVDPIATEVVRVLEVRKIPVTIKGVVRGPTIITVSCVLADGVRVHQILNARPDLAVAFGKNGVRVVVPTRNPGYVNIEIPLAPEDRTPVPLDRLLTEYRPDIPNQLVIPLGYDGQWTPHVVKTSEVPHLLIAGTTGSGKSTFLHSIVQTVRTWYPPDMVAMAIIDLKLVEFAQRYADMPHLLYPVATTKEEAQDLLARLVEIMKSRYQELKKRSYVNLTQWKHNDPSGAPPLILLIVDEIGDLTLNRETSEKQALLELLRKGRAAGIHVVVSTQRPSVDTLPGDIKANLPGRLSFGLPSTADSQTVLGRPGAENLFGAGDALYCTLGGAIIRVQSPLVTPPSPTLGTVSRNPTVDSLSRAGSGILVHPDQEERNRLLERLRISVVAHGGTVCLIRPTEMNADDLSSSIASTRTTPRDTARQIIDAARLAVWRRNLGATTAHPHITVVDGFRRIMDEWRRASVLVGKQTRPLDVVVVTKLVSVLTAHDSNVHIWLVDSAPLATSDLPPKGWDAIRQHGWVLSPYHAIPTPLRSAQERNTSFTDETLTVILHGSIAPFCDSTDAL